MLNLIIPAITSLLLTALAYRLFQVGKFNTIRKKLFSEKPQITHEKTIELAIKYGRNSNSFMTLYPGFEYFTSNQSSQPGTIAFLEMSYAWIGGAEPFTHPDHLSTFLLDFANSAAACGKSAVLLPVSQEVAKKAEEVGYHSILIGCEPTIDLEKYPKTGHTWIDVIPTAKQLESKGAKVFEFDPATCSKSKLDTFNLITEEWLKSRKMDPLGFLNKVEPWTLSEYKRYFYIELNGRILAFLAGIPIWSRQGWYLIDTLRRNDAPAGTTELLTLSAMRILKESGAKEVCFGVSPLAQIEKAQSIPLAQSESHSTLYSFLKFLYEKGGWFYNFKSLFHYKVKFKPNRYEPAFLIYKNLKPDPIGMRLRDVLNVFQAFSRKGITQATWSNIRRTIQNFSLIEWIQRELKTTIIVRSAPKTWRRLLYRCKFTVIVAIINLILYAITTEPSGLIIPSIEKEWSYTWGGLFQSPLHALLLSPFLHWNLVHLNFNLTAMFFFTGGLEFLAGTSITMTCYIIAMLLSNPCTSWVLTQLNLTTPYELDVGASLGIFGCAGALSGFLRHGPLLLLGLYAGTFISAYDTKQWLVMNHWAAILIGIIIGRILIRN